MNKQRYEYYHGTKEIIDHNTETIIEDVVEYLNTQDKELVKLSKFDELNKDFFNLIRATFKEHPEKFDEVYTAVEQLKTHHEKEKILFAVNTLEAVWKTFSMRVGVLDSNLDLLSDILEETKEKIGYYKVDGAE